MDTPKIEEMVGKTNCELTLLAFRAGMILAGAAGNLTPAQEEARRIFLAAYRELLYRPAQTGRIEARGRRPLTWTCSHAGFEMSHPDFGKVTMTRDARSSTGYRIEMAKSRAAQAS